ncbi:hypothetical protein [Microbispora triticiradicis]|uniref:hypothetical protein n=1 Tax=Microbispora triticiradicis TaxID=2200763 RepID=UPI001AD70930|nr:hypothetical protein [Microbispora triticiradicis]MBO4272320.1 hypothetical protein [Microbispora triticiradicis]
MDDRSEFDRPATDRILAGIAGSVPLEPDRLDTVAELVEAMGLTADAMSTTGPKRAPALRQL